MSASILGVSVHRPPCLVDRADVSLGLQESGDQEGVGHADDRRVLLGVGIGTELPVAGGVQQLAERAFQFRERQPVEGVGELRARGVAPGLDLAHHLAAEPDALAQRLLAPAAFDAQPLQLVSEVREQRVEFCVHRGALHKGS